MSKLNPDDLTQAKSPDDVSFFNEGTLSAVEENQKLKQQLANMDLTLGHVVNYVGFDNLPSAEELVQYQDETYEERISDLQYSDEGRKIIEDSLAEKGQASMESQEGTEDEYVQMWQKHRKETRGEC